MAYTVFTCKYDSSSRSNTRDSFGLWILDVRYELLLLRCILVAFTFVVTVPVADVCLMSTVLLSAIMSICVFQPSTNGTASVIDTEILQFTFVFFDCFVLLLLLLSTLTLVSLRNVISLLVSLSVEFAAGNNRSVLHCKYSLVCLFVFT